MIISVSGVGYAGAGAIYDLVCEYRSVEHLSNSFEFGIMYEADGLLDLVNKLKYNNTKVTSYVPIRRFVELAKFYNDFPWFAKFTNGFLYNEALKFIKSLGVVECDGFQLFDYVDVTWKDKMVLGINLFLPKISNFVLKRAIALPLNNRRMYLYYGDRDIVEDARFFMQNVFDHLRTSPGSKLLIKHLLPPDNPESCMMFLREDVRHITVMRDPRDLYILGLTNNTSDFPCRDVNVFISYYKHEFPLLKAMPANCCIVRFEDLCYRYEETVKQVEKFLLLSPEEHVGRSVFVPEVSINNTALYKKFPQYEKDINQIALELKEYIYPFDNTNII